jgi:hypothetical protein
MRGRLTDPENQESTTNRPAMEPQIACARNMRWVYNHIEAVEPVAPMMRMCKSHPIASGANCTIFQSNAMVPRPGVPDIA